MVGVGNGRPRSSLVMKPNQELWKAQGPLSKMEGTEQISVKGDMR